jgi:hypothetical protein
LDICGASSKELSFKREEFFFGLCLRPKREGVDISQELHSFEKESV